MTCPHCQSPFTPTHGHQRYCSLQCRGKARRALEKPLSVPGKRTRRYGPDSLPAEVRELRESRVLELQAKYAGWAYD